MTTLSDNQKSKCCTIENNILIGAEEIVDSEQKIGPLILKALNEYPDHVSQIDAETGAQTTNAEMKNHGIRCALWLKKLGIGPNDIVVACTHNHLDAYVPLLASFFVDTIFCGWHYSITVHIARRYLKQFEPKVIFSCEAAADVLLEASRLEKIDVKIVVFGKHASLPTLSGILNDQTEQEVDNFTIVNAKSPEEVVLIWMSSGSSGFPKGVTKSSKALLAHWLKPRYPQCQPQSVFLWYSTYEWTSCIIYMFRTIFTKQTRIIPSRVDVENAFQIIEKYKIDQVLFPPVLVAYIAKSRTLAQKYNLTSLKVIIVTGSKISREILEELKQNIPNAFIFSNYGTTEIGVITGATAACKRVDSVGFVSTDCQIKFVDLVTGESLGPNRHGELCGKSPYNMSGYYNNPEATKETYDEDGWYRSGDIGYYDEDGEIFIVDRIREMMKFRSQAISPAEIEEILLSHPDIQEAVVVPIPHKIDGDLPTAFCKRAPGSKVTEDELMKLMLVLEDYKKLRGGIHFMDSFPHTSCGKIARTEMKMLAKELIKLESE